MIWRPRGLALGAVVSLLSACGSGEHFLPWPDLPADIESVVLFVDSEGTIEAQALAWDERSVARSMPAGAEADLTLLALSGTLEENELPEGDVELVEGDACLALPFPPSSSVFVASEADDKWTERSELPARLSNLDRKVPCPCPELEVREEYVIEGTVTGGDAQAFIYDDVLYYVGNRNSFEVEIEPELSATPLPFRGLSLKDHWVAPDGTLYLTSAGRILSWEIGSSSSTAIFRDFEDSYQMIGIDGAPAGEETEIFVTSEGSRIERFDGQQWSVVYEDQGPFEVGGGDQEGRIAWTGVDSAIAALHDTRRYVLYARGQAQTLDRTAEIDAFRAVANNPTMGVVFGTGTGQVVRVMPAGAVLLSYPEGEAPRPGAIETFAHFRDGELYATELAGLGYVNPRYGLCPLRDASGFSELDGVVTRGEDVFVVGRSVDGEVRLQRLAPL